MTETAPNKVTMLQFKVTTPGPIRRWIAFALMYVGEFLSDAGNNIILAGFDFELEEKVIAVDPSGSEASDEGL